jgi:hypothetical protein
MSIGLWLTMSAKEHLQEINKTRAEIGLKPMLVDEFLANTPKGIPLQTPEGKPNPKVFQHFAQEANVEAKAAKAALKSLPKGTFSNVVDDVAKKVALPAAAAGAGLEALRRRKNKNAAVDLAAEAKATAAAATELPVGIGRATGNAAQQLGMGLFDRGGALFSGVYGLGSSYIDAGTRAEQTVDETMSFPEVQSRQFQYPVGANPFGMGTTPMAGNYPDMRRQGAIAKEISTDPNFYYDAAFRAGDAFTMGALTRNQEYNRRSGMDGELSMGEQLMNFGKSAAAIPLDILSLGNYDYATLGPEFSPNFASMSESVNKVTMSKEDEIRAATKRMQTPSK